MRIAIITALPQELKIIKSKIKNIVKIESPYTLFKGDLKNHHIICGFSQPGKVAASSLTQHIIDKHIPSLIINSGISGGLNKKLAIGDVLISNRFIQFDYKIGFSKNGEYWNPVYNSEILTTNAPDFINSNNMHLFGTGDQFINNKAQKKALLDLKIDACDMESGAIAQVSYVNDIDFFSIRGISDIGEGTPIDFGNNMKLAIRNSTEKLLKLLR